MHSACVSSSNLVNFDMQIHTNDQLHPALIVLTFDAMEESIMGDVIKSSVSYDMQVVTMSPRLAK